MLTRFRFYSIMAGLFAAALVCYVLVSSLVGRSVHLTWLSEALGIVMFAVAQGGFWWLTGGHTSYRKYVASQGGELVLPSRFWATTGPVVVCLVASAVLVAVSRIASSAPTDSGWRSAAIAAWVVVPGWTLVFLLIARDWRRELASSSDAA